MILVFSTRAVGYGHFGHIVKIASLSRQEPQPAGTVKWQTTLRFGKILGTTSLVRSTEREPTTCCTKDSQAMISYK